MEKVLNNASVRIENRKKVAYYLLSAGKKTKQELSNDLSISLPTIHTLVSQLEDLGLIARVSAGVSMGGRIPNYLCIRHDAYYAIGVEISQDHILTLVIDLANKIVDRKNTRMDFFNSSDYWIQVKDQVQKIIEKNNLQMERIMGVGIAVPGTVTAEKKYIEFAPTLKLNNFDYQILDGVFGMPVIVENEANAAGLAEVRVHHNIENAIYLSITKGVGGAIIHDGQILNGNNGRCGEFGHMMLVPHGLRCSCGKSGCFEAYCSTKVLTCHTDGDLDAFFKQLPFDKTLQCVWEDYMEYLSIGISNLIIATDMSLILGGTIVDGIREYFEQLKGMVEKMNPFKNDVLPLALSYIGRDAAALGCSIMISEKFMDELLTQA